MISVFPALYPDELLCSAYARYKHLVGYKYDLYVWRDLFGSNHHRGRILFEPDFTSLRNNIPKGWLPCTITLMRDHLLESLFRLGTGLVDKRKYFLEFGEPFWFNSFPPIMESERLVMGLACCHECVRNDYLQHGETFWRRSQNIFGMFLCLKHMVFLKYVNVPRSQGGAALVKPINLEEIELSDAVNNDDPKHRLLVRLATDLADLLTLVEMPNGRALLYELIRKTTQSLGPSFLRFPCLTSIPKLIEEMFDSKMLEALTLSGLKLEGHSLIKLCKPVNLHICSPVGIVAGLNILGIRPSDVFSMDDNIN